MILGDKSDFAVEFYDDCRDSVGRAIGRISCWANGIEIGNIEEPGCLLGTTAAQFGRVKKHLARQRIGWFGSDSDREVFKTIHDWIFGEPESEVCCPGGYGVYHFLTDDGDSFSGMGSFCRKKLESVQLMVFSTVEANAGRGVNPQFFDVSNEGFFSSVNGFIEWWEKLHNNALNPP